MANNKDESVGKKILILKRSKQSLSGVEKYLSKRGWILFSTEELKVAVLKAMEMKPDYIFIAFDHPNPKATSLPKVFKQVLLSRTIPFVEIQSSYALHTMKKCDPKYFLTPPIIGPKIERILFKIEHDKQHENDPAQQKTRVQFPSAGGEEMMIRVRGSGGGKKMEATSEAFKSLELKNQDEPSFLDRDKIFNPAAVAGSERYAEESEFFDEVYGRATELSLDSNPDQEDPEVTMDLVGQAMKELLQQAPDSLKAKDLETPQSYEQRMMALFTTYAKKNQLKIKDVGDDFKLHFRSALEDSTFKTLKYLENSFEKQDVAQILSNTKGAECFLIQGDGFKGYFIAASSSGPIRGPEKKINYFKLIEEKLKEYLKESEAQVDVSESIQIQFQEVNFQSWSVEKADFVHKAILDGEEVALAYFSADHPDLVTRESKDRDMLAISLHEFMGGVPVEFDLFIHLPANDKYIHYTKEGFALSLGQKDRLDNRGVEAMHIQNEDLPDLKKYRVQNYFNSIIQDFKKQKGAA